MSETARRREVDLPRVTSLTGAEQVRVIQGGTGKRADLSEDLLAWLAEQFGTLAAANAPTGAVGEDGVLRYPVMQVAGKGGFGGDGIITLEADDISDAEAAGKAVLRAATQTEGRTALGLGTAATEAAGAFALASHTHLATGISDSTAIGRAVIKAADAAAARTALELGGASALDVGSTGGTVAAGDDVRLLPGKSLVGSADPGATHDTAAGFAPGSLALNTASGITFRARDTSNGAAKWTPQQPRAWVSPIAGRYIGPILTATPAATTVTASLLYAHPVFVPRRVTLSALLLRISTAVAGVTGRLGIYTHDEATCAPGVLVAESNVDLDMGGTAATYPTATFASNPTLEPGVYWFAAAFNGAAIPSGFSGGIHGGGLTWLVSHNSPQNALFSTGASNGFRQSASVVYAGSGVPFFPATFGAGVYSGTTGSPLIAGLVA